MITSPTAISPGFYQYTYPTFVDEPQYICVHFLTPDGQQAFVSYPHNQARKAASLISIDWFQSVMLCQLEGQPQLMTFLTKFFTQDSDKRCIKLGSGQWLPTDLTRYELSQQLMA
ncbi:hypothetical protein SD10_07920 [Spirosoma radiotolerans]|uniref:Uncharacterized protein n=1 Tax=Spirosoma radiotolerans TaxID=1379870 RepID=A0A0E3ZV15_9BACT|nr:hypothetical protein SD10_07920 [Spirosoma radiotolerans]